MVPARKNPAPRASITDLPDVAQTRLDIDVIGDVSQHRLIRRIGDAFVLEDPVCKYRAEHLDGCSCWYWSVRLQQWRT